MIIRPKIRGFICTTSHPKGCEANVLEQIQYVKSRGPIANGPKNVLVIGASTGYGLASRITAAFGSGAKTVGIYFEREPEANKTAWPGWYNSLAFEKFAKQEGLYTKSINGDAFSDEIKAQTIELLKKEVGPVDLVVYSIAAPRRTHPKTGYIAKSVLKPIGQPFSSKTLDTDKAELKTISIEPATEEEIKDTITVMGGEDWELWIEALDKAGLLAKDCKTVAYTYLGAKPTWPIYGKGTIGKAKEDLERAVKALNTHFQSENKGQSAYIAVLKAIVTQASSAIPIMPLYISLLYKIMKERKVHENSIEQIFRLFSTQLYNPQHLQSDELGRIRLDDLELQPEIQKLVEERWEQVTNENLYEITDFKGYQEDFLKLFGFGLASIDYDAEVEL